MSNSDFIKEIYAYYKTHRRSFPWRECISPYRVLVSEIMLQQTQAPRVVAKYNEFIKKFPSLKKLNEASTKDVLSAWQGLGYNRRALYLKSITKIPKTYEELVELPGIGPNTAGSILAFAYNIPHPFIETNIRSVYIHFFFKNKEKVDDKEIMELIKETLDQKNPREWYYALMDYGAMLKKTANPSLKSKHYKKQSPFKGSHREKRGKVLKILLEKPDKLLKYKNIAEELLKEGFIKKVNEVYYIHEK